MNKFVKPSPLKLAIVSTYDEMCGIAAYTRKLVPQLEDNFDITVFDLDQLFMRAQSHDVRMQADQQIKDMCEQLKSFDVVNLQLEYGTLGYFETDIVRRLEWILDAASQITVTFHTILTSQRFPTDALRTAFFKFELYNSYRVIADYRLKKNFRKRVYNAFRQTQKNKAFSAIVHTKRDARRMRIMDGITNVFDHPLAFISLERAEEVRQVANWRDFPLLADLPEQSTVVGVFGFLGRYKGMHTALKAMRHLPENYHLAFFGGLHPQEIQPSDAPHEYVQHLMSLVGADETLVDVLAGEHLKNAPPEGGSTLSLAINVDDPEKLMQNLGDLSSRVHFMGAQSDDDLELAIAACDIVLLPYFEVGQSSSGPMSLATDLGARIVASRNQAFMQFARYHEGRLSFFEIGNHLELAKRVVAEERRTAPDPRPEFNTETNRAVYEQAFACSNLATANTS